MRLLLPFLYFLAIILRLFLVSGDNLLEMRVLVADIFKGFELL